MAAVATERDGKVYPGERGKKSPHLHLGVAKKKEKENILIISLAPRASRGKKVHGRGVKGGDFFFLAVVEGGGGKRVRGGGEKDWESREWDELEEKR